MIIYGKWEVLVSNLLNLLDLLDIDIKWEDQRISSDCIGVALIMKRIHLMYLLLLCTIGLYIPDSQLIWNSFY